MKRFFTGLVTTIATLGVEYRAGMLRISNAADETLALLDDGKLYQLPATAPAGHVYIQPFQLADKLPDLVRILVKNQIIEVIEERRFAADDVVVIAKVLVPATDHV